MTTPRYGFRIVGPAHNDRRLVDYRAAWQAYCQCNDDAQLHEGGFLSPYQYGPEMAARSDGYRLDVRGFVGECWSEYLWFDIDRKDQAEALADCRRLASYLIDRYGIDPSCLLVFYSGNKGYHVGLPTALWQPTASVTYPRQCRRMAEALAASALVTIDPVIYQAVQPFRAPNSRHLKTGLFKVWISFERLMSTDVDFVLGFAKCPRPFNQRDKPQPSLTAADDWINAAVEISPPAEAVESERTELNEITLSYIRGEIEEGDRHRLLYSSAANLRELGATERIADALLRPAALDVGLCPGDISRAIRNAFQK